MRRGAEGRAQDDSSTLLDWTASFRYTLFGRIFVTGHVRRESASIILWRYELMGGATPRSDLLST